MAYFAKISALNVVEQVIVADQAFIDSLGNKAQWLETAVDGSIRGRYAGPGHTFDPLNETFTTAMLDTSTLGSVITAVDPRLDISDAPTIAERSNVRLRFARSINDSAGNNFKAASPGARLRFSTNATTLDIGVKFTDFATNANWNTSTHVLVNGSPHTAFTSSTANGTPSTKKVTLSFGDASTRLIELVWPYGDSMDFLYLRTNPSATISTPPARPAAKICVVGDSITQGLLTSNILSTWPFKLGTLKNAQVVNMGYGGLPAQAGDASAVTPDCTVIIYAMGYNNAYANQPANTFQSVMTANLRAMRLAAPSARIYAVSPIYTTTLNLAGYRAAVQSAVSAAADENVRYINGLSIMTNNANRLVDGIHPNDTGAAEIASALSGVL